MTANGMKYWIQIKKKKIKKKSEDCLLIQMKITLEAGMLWISNEIEDCKREDRAGKNQPWTKISNHFSNYN